MAAENVEQLCIKARQAIEGRDWTKAKQSYLLALALRSDLPDVHYGLATVYFQLKELTSAAHHFREVVRLDPLRVGALINLGAVLNLLDEPDEAVLILRRAIQLDPKRPESFYNLGLVHRRKGETEMAIQSYREALRLNSRMADAHLNLANLFIEKGQNRQARVHYEEALKIRPNWQKALDGLDVVKVALNEAAAPPTIEAPKRHTGGFDPDLVVDPGTHATFLGHLHQSSGEAEEGGKRLEQLLEAEIEVAIKDLSACLLHTEGSRQELAASIQRFEAAMQNLKSARGQWTHSLDRIRELSGQFPQS